MTFNFSMFRRAYDAMAMFAVLNMVAFVGIAAYLLGSGTMNGEKLRRLAQALQADGSHEEVEAQAEPQPSAPSGNPTPMVSGAVTPMNSEILRREAERIKAELDQRLALNNSILLRITQEREALRREREAEAARRDTSQQQRDQEGFEKQIEIFEALAPKVAVEHVLSINDPDEAARVLLEMDTRNAKKIVEAAKRPDQMHQMKGILQRLREVAPDRSAELIGQEE